VQPWANATVKGYGTKTTPATWTLPAGHYKVTLVNEERNKKTTVSVTIDPAKPVMISRDWTK